MTKKIVLFLVLVLILTAGLTCTTAAVSRPDDSKTWLSPGKIQIGNLLPGNSAKQKITIHNGSEAAATFLVYYRIPDYVEDSFVVAPTDARGWVTIEEDAPVLAPRETREIEIVLDLPDETQTPERWEFWVGVREDKAGSLTTELCRRWLVTMRGK
jgi:hypothetical protein